MNLRSRGTRVKLLAVVVTCAFSAPTMAKLVVGVGDNGHCIAVNFPGAGQSTTVYDLGVMPAGACHFISWLVS